MMTDNSKFREGLPCFKYILNRLQHEEQAHNFTKFYVDTMISLSFKDEEIEDMLGLINIKLHSEHPLKNHDFSSWPYAISGMGLVASVHYSDYTTSYRHCYDFYKQYNSPTKACQICPLSSKYVNGKQDAEQLLLCYAAASCENMDYLLDKGIKSEHFICKEDILESFMWKTVPYIVNVHRSIFTFLTKQKAKGKGYSFENNKEKVSGYLFKELNRHLEKCGEADAQSLAMKLSLVYVERILNMENTITIGVEQVDAAVESILHNEEKSKQKPINRKSNMGVSEINAFCSSGEEMELFFSETSFLGNSSSLEESFLNDGSLKETDEFVATSLPSEKSEGEDVQEGITPPAIEEVICEDCEEQTEENVAEYQIVVADMDEHSASDGGFEEGVNGDGGKAHAEDADEIEHLAFRELGNVYDEAGLMLFDTKDSFIGIPCVPYKELAHFAISLDAGTPRLLSLFESHVMKDKRIAVELVVAPENGKNYLLFYSPRMHAYFFTDMTKPYVRDIVTTMLTYPSVKKYCYYPFALSSILMRLGVHIKGMYSLFSLSATLFPNHKMGMYEALEVLGATKAVGGEHVVQEGIITSLPLWYMHCYHRVYERQFRKLLKQGYSEEFMQRNQFDIILSRYYYQDLYMKNPSRLFKAVTSGKYHFSYPADAVYKEHGKVITYAFRNIPLAPSVTIRELLCRMEDKGYMKKYRFMLVALTPTSFSIFVKNEDVSKLDTVINTTLLFFLRENGLRGLEYSSDVVTAQT